MSIEVLWQVGLKNYAAAYCTGLLLARRTLEKVGLGDAFEGKAEATGDEFHVEDDFDGDKRPFKAVLDVGLKRTTVGSKVAAARFNLQQAYVFANVGGHALCFLVRVTVFVVALDGCVISNLAAQSLCCFVVEICSRFLLSCCSRRFGKVPLSTAPSFD